MPQRLATALFLSTSILLLSPSYLDAQSPELGNTSPSAAETKANRKHDSKQAEKAYRHGLDAAKHENYEAALKDFSAAVDLNPARPEYLQAREMVRQQWVKTLMARADDQLVAKSQDAAKTLARIQEIDPQNPLLQERMRQLAITQGPAHIRHDEAYADAEIKLDTKPGDQPFHIRGNTRSAYEQLARMYGLTVIFDNALPSKEVRIDVDKINFEQLTNLLQQMTRTFYVPISSKQFLVSADTVENRKQYERLWVETFYLGEASTPQELNDIANLFRNIFQARFLAVNQSSGTITVKAPHVVLDAFTAIVDALSSGEPEVRLQVDFIDVAQAFTRQLGTTLPLQFTIFNVPTEERNLLNSVNLSQLNGSSLGNLGAGAIAALLAQGQNSPSSLIQQPIAVFGGGKTLSGVVVPPASFTANQSTSWLRHLQSSTILATQGKDSTLRAGTRYPIVTSLYSAASIPSVPNSVNGLNPSQVQQQALPQFTYADLGVTLKATPTIHASGDVTLKLSLQIQSLGAQAINGVPVINNEQYEGSVTLKEGDLAVVAGALTKSNVQAISGIPLLSLVPGLGPLASQTTKQVEDDSLLILITPTLVRGSFPRSAEVLVPQEK